MFGNRFFSRRTIGAELILFRVMEITGAILCGRFLDREGSDASDTRRRTAAVCLIVFLAVNSSGNILAYMQECTAKQNRTPTTLLSFSQLPTKRNET